MYLRGLKKYSRKNNENSIIVKLNIDINFMFNFFKLEKSSKLKFMTVLPSLSRNVYHGVNGG